MERKQWIIDSRRTPRSGTRLPWSMSVGGSDVVWLFVRGRQSVRITRREHANGRADLVVRGPAVEERTDSFDSIPECMQRQSEMEAALLAEGFALQRQPDRRRDRDRRRVTRHDRRQSRGE